MRETELVSKIYCTAVTVEEMKNILAHDGTDVSLYANLDSISGVREIEYDAHLGPYVWYTIDTPFFDLPEIHSQIQKAISNAARKQ